MRARNGSGSAGTMRASPAGMFRRHSPSVLLIPVVVSLASLVACTSAPEEEDTSDDGSSALFGSSESSEVRDMDGESCTKSKQCGKGGTCEFKKPCLEGETPATTNPPCKLVTSWAASERICIGGKKKWTKEETASCSQSRRSHCLSACNDGTCITKLAKPIDEDGDGE